MNDASMITTGTSDLLQKSFELFLHISMSVVGSMASTSDLTHQKQLGKKKLSSKLTITHDGGAFCMD